MNRRNVIKLLVGLLPCAIAARMLGEKDLHGTPSPTPLHTPLPIQPFTEGFHVEVRELAERYDMDGKLLLPCFRATIRDCRKNPHYQMMIQSPVFCPLDHNGQDQRRRALDCLYISVARVIRQRQFPKDTLIYDAKVTVNGVKLMNPRYP